MENIYLSIPNKPEYFSSVRLFVTGIAAKLNLDIDYIEDIKIALNEGLTIAYKLQCNQMINIAFQITQEKLKINIGEVCEEEINQLENLYLSTTIINCLVDDSYIQDEELNLIINL